MGISAVCAARVDWTSAEVPELMILLTIAVGVHSSNSVGKCYLPDWGKDSRRR
jgi:hypothetical protein